MAVGWYVVGDPLVPTYKTCRVLAFSIRSILPFQQLSCFNLRGPTTSIKEKMARMAHLVRGVGRFPASVVEGA